MAAVAETKKGPKRVKGRKAPKKVVAAPAFDHNTDRVQPLIFFQSLSGTTERYATQFAQVLADWTRYVVGMQDTCEASTDLVLHIIGDAINPSPS